MSKIEICRTPKTVARFEKVSREFYDRATANVDTGIDFLYGKDNCTKNILPYDDLIIPKRATRFSAGYDFYSPMDLVIPPKKREIIPTFIKCKIDTDCVLVICPRSGFALKNEVMLTNTVGIIDADYYNSVSDTITNEGNILICISNLSSTNSITLSKGERFCQGLFLPYFSAMNDDNEELMNSVRQGGAGSTGND